VGSWYRVTKKINGRLYDYWQRTYRVGRSVKTENKYIGPAGEIMRLAQMVVSNKASNLKIFERDGRNALGNLTGKKVYHLEGQVPYPHPEIFRDAPPPAVMEFETKREAVNVMRTAQRIAARNADPWTDHNSIAQHKLAEKNNDLFIKADREREARRVALAAAPTTTNAISNDALYKLTPLRVRDPTGISAKIADAIRREDERIQYGPLKARLKRQRQKFLAAKRKTRGIKALNPFLAQALLSTKKA
jgi:hypothetical protein